MTNREGFLADAEVIRHRATELSSERYQRLLDETRDITHWAREHAGPVLQEYVPYFLRLIGWSSGVESLQTMRGSANVRSVDVHDFLGICVQGPCIGKDGLWYAAGEAYNSGGKTTQEVQNSETVFAANEAILQRGGKAEDHIHLLMFGQGFSLVTGIPQPAIGPIALLNVTKPPFGYSKVLGGPRTVLSDFRGTKSVGAVLFLAGGPSGIANFLTCHYQDIDVPATFSRQAPTSVYVGMRTYEIYAQLAGAILDAAIGTAVSNLTDAIMGKVAEIASAALRRFAIWALRQLGRVARVLRNLVRAVVRGTQREGRGQIGEGLDDEVSNQLGERAPSISQATLSALLDTPQDVTPGQDLENTLCRWMDETP